MSRCHNFTPQHTLRRSFGTNSCERTPFITDLLEHCIKNTYFSFKEQIYLQENRRRTNGIFFITGQRQSVHDAFWNKNLENAKLKPNLTCRRHCHNMVTRKSKTWQFSLVYEFLIPANEIYFGNKNNNSLRLLDVLIVEHNGNLQYLVYRKSTQNGRFLS